MEKNLNLPLFLAFFVTIFSLIVFSPTFAQQTTTETTTAQTAAVCPTSYTCPDSTVVSCGVKDNQCFCESCPVTTQATTTPTCPTYPKSLEEMKAECVAAGGSFSIFTDAYGCQVTECKGLTAATPAVVGVCPSYGKSFTELADECKSAGGSFSIISDQSGCASPQCNFAYTEVKDACPVYSKSFDELRAECSQAGSNFYTYTDSRGCTYAKCKTFTSGEYACPAVYNPVCGTDGRTYPNDCEARVRGVPIASYGECTQFAPKPKELPPECKKFVDPTGVERVVCAFTPYCPRSEELGFAKQRCEAHGGKFSTFSDTATGCTLPQCNFGEFEFKPNPIVGHASCPTRNEVDAHVQACRASGLHPALTIEGGCQVVKCVERPIEACAALPAGVLEDVERSCAERGLAVVQDFSPEGCPLLRCSAPEFCPREPPEEAVRTCAEHGGEFVAKKDANGCIRYATCVVRGDETEAYVDPVERVPEPTDLLEVALKLEKVKVKLDQLQREALDIAEYYSSVGSLDEERFRRVVSMLDAAKEKIDEIRSELRENLDTLTREDLAEIKHDIKYLKNVMLKDLVYVMLSSDEDLKEDFEEGRRLRTARTFGEIEATVDDCGTDGYCFERNFRTCTPIKFRPEADAGPIIAIVGLEGDVCIVKAILPEGVGPPPGFIPGVNPPYEMTCRFDNYALGIRGPQDFLEKCEGSMQKLMEQFGGPGAHVSGGQPFPPPEGGPGGCTSAQTCAQYCLQNYDDCVEWTRQHPAYGTVPPREALERIARGEFGTSGAGFVGPGGCRGEIECSQFCRQNPRICFEWCEQNPNICPGQAREEFERTFGTTGQVVLPQVREIQRVPACFGCFNNGVCEVGECSACGDCSR